MQLPGHPLFKDITGERFGRLLVVSYMGRAGKNKISSWLCKCDCGNEKVISSNGLHQGTKSCGCFHRERFSRKTHGMSKEPEYRVWKHMIERCRSPSAVGYEHYGGRGICVCVRWMESFENFISDMGCRPSAKHEIDRIDVNGNYEPGNCRWATQTENRRNKRIHRLITFNGKTLCLNEWAEELGTKRHNLFNRLKRGWSVEKTMTTPFQ